MLFRFSSQGSTRLLRFVDWFLYPVVFTLIFASCHPTPPVDSTPALLAASCREDAVNAPPYADEPSANSISSSRGHARTIKVATFNVKVFGQAKANRPEVMCKLAEIVRRYDVIVIQEIKDSTLQVPRLLLTAINSMDGPDYDMRVSPRTGQQEDDRRSQEQYAFYYDIK
jgi:hypothetical protein